MVVALSDNLFQTSLQSNLSTVSRSNTISILQKKKLRLERLSHFSEDTTASERQEQDLNSSQLGSKSLLLYITKTLIIVSVYQSLDFLWKKTVLLPLIIPLSPSVLMRKKQKRYTKLEGTVGIF